MGGYTPGGYASGKITPVEHLLNRPNSWLFTICIALIGLGVNIAYSPLTNRIASYLVQEAPNLETIRVIQQSKVKLIAGVVAAWVLGGLLDELICRGIVLKAIDSWLSG